MQATRVIGKGLVAFLEGVNDRDAAAALVGRDIAMYRHQLPPPGAGQYYWSDLIGMAVVTRTGVSLGKVVDMRETGANDVMVVDGAEPRLLPWVMHEVILEVDMENRRITVEWQDGYQ